MLLERSGWLQRFKWNSVKPTTELKVPEDPNPKEGLGTGAVAADVGAAPKPNPKEGALGAGAGAAVTKRKEGAGMGAEPNEEAAGATINAPAPKELVVGVTPYEPKAVEGGTLKPGAAAAETEEGTTRSHPLPSAAPSIH